MINRPIQRQYASDSNQQVKRKNKNVTEEHRVINTSKNIYKPCFNMPARDNHQKPEAPAKKEGPPKILRSNSKSTLTRNTEST